MCQNPFQLNCFLNWRSFNETYYPNDWNYGDDFICINPITFKKMTLYGAIKMNTKVFYFQTKEFCLKEVCLSKMKKDWLG